MDPLEVSSIKKLGKYHYYYSDFGNYMRQLYSSIGKDLRGA